MNPQILKFRFPDKYKKDAKVGFFTFGYIQNNANTGSTRIRAEWPIKYWPEAEFYQIGKKYETVIFQKTYFTMLAERFNGVKIFDLCDPDWFEGAEVKKMINLCDAVSCPTERFAQTLRKFSNKQVYVVPDRMDLEYYKQRKIHNKKAESVVWFGYSQNQGVLDQAVQTLRDMKLKLIVISDSPYDKADINIKWDLETVNDEIIKGDIVIMPITSRFKHQYKSNNKITSAWALGMPVAKTAEDLHFYMDPENRKKESIRALQEVKDKYDVKLSVEDYKKIIHNVKNAKSSPKNN